MSALFCTACGVANQEELRAEIVVDGLGIPSLGSLLLGDTMESRSAVSALVTKFRRNLESYKIPSYNETQLRREFLDPFFEALGWDVANKRGYSEAYKSVLHEDHVRSLSGSKHPDYSFRIGGVRKFFVEAKKPAVNIRTDPGPAYQLRRYSWSAKLQIGVLTDFEELVVYDTRKKPKPDDAAKVARIASSGFEEYEERWDELAGLLSEGAVLRGDLDRFIDGKGARRGTEEVDQAFLAEIEDWRIALAKMFAKHNPALAVRELNRVVQATIDRIVFLRICEDRDIEGQGTLLACAGKEGVYQALGELFRKADDRYNSGLFHFKKERGRSSGPDLLSLDLGADDKTFRRILEGLYYPKSPYEFSVLPADTLGQVYERFLGSVIRLTPSHRAVVEERPEVRKAGGVFYTPTHIVDGIVEEALRPLFEGLTAARAANVKIVDPACGSGTFLLQAYEFLLKWYLDHYEDSGPEARARAAVPAIRRASSGGWELTLPERKRIVLTHLFGVDLDAQAVEVTKLSLLLRVLQGASYEQMSLLPERALPDLDGNIKQGNSLIDSQYLSDRELADGSDDDSDSIAPFDWEVGFPEIMARGGFDAVVGNPPYVLLQWAETPRVEAYLSANYRAAKYKIDTYLVFMERGVHLLRPQGRLGFIVPSSWFRNKYARDLREFLLRRTEIISLRIFDYPVFKASVDTCSIVVERRNRARKSHKVAVEWETAPGVSGKRTTILQQSWLDGTSHEISPRADAGARAIIKKMKARGKPVGTFADAYFGIQTHSRTKFVSDKKATKDYQPAIDGANIDAWALHPSTEYVDTRPVAIKSGGDPTVYAKDRIVFRQIGETPVGAIASPGILTLNTIYNVFLRQDADVKLEFVLAAFASKAGRWYWRTMHSDEKRAYPKIKKAALLAFPIPALDINSLSDRKRHDSVVACVKRLQSLGESLIAARDEAAKTRLARRIEIAEADLDLAVAECYGLTPDDVAQMQA